VARCVTASRFLVVFGSLVTTLAGCSGGLNWSVVETAIPSACVAGRRVPLQASVLPFQDNRPAKEKNLVNRLFDPTASLVIDENGTRILPTLAGQLGVMLAAALQCSGSFNAVYAEVPPGSRECRFVEATLGAGRCRTGSSDVAIEGSIERLLPPQYGFFPWMIFMIPPLIPVGITYEYLDKEPTVLDLGFVARCTLDGSVPVTYRYRRELEFRRADEREWPALWLAYDATRGSYSGFPTGSRGERDNLSTAGHRKAGIAQGASE